MFERFFKLIVVNILLVFVAVFFLGGCILSNAPPREKLEEIRGVLLVIWDAVDRRRINELLHTGNLFTLSELLEMGSKVDIDITDHRTDTFGGHVQIYTGYSPLITDIAKNSDGGKGSIPQGLTIFERVKNSFPDAKIYVINGVLDTKKDWPLYFARNFIDKFRYVSDTGRWARFSCKIALQELSSIKRDDKFLIVVRFEEATHWGYLYGENSSTYLEAIKVCDRYTGKIINKLKETGLYKNTAIFITSDHGYNKGGYSHSNAPGSWLVTNFKGLVNKGDQKQIAPTIYKIFGIEIGEMRPSLSPDLFRK